MTTGLDRTYHAHSFILVSHFNFLFVPCGRHSWLPVSFLLHVKYTLVSYRIVHLEVVSSVVFFAPAFCDCCRYISHSKRKKTISLMNAGFSGSPS